MSGIVGIVNLDGAPVDRDLLQRLTDALAFRGPDAQEIWTDGRVGFGHSMLRTTWEAETEKQPLSLNGQVWLTADARIDGRAELIAKLETKLQRGMRTGLENPNGLPNDAELILLAYEAWGEDCVNHLIGDFALAIWDATQSRLFCARDHFGVKLFYYALVGKTFVFSNTLECIRLHPEVSENLNEIAIGDYLLFGLNQDLTSTTFEDIHRLPQASHLTVSNSKTTIRTFWRPSTESCVRFAQPAEYVEQFKALLSRAISDRLRTERVSISMSGGLDSTSVAALASGPSPGNGAGPFIQACTVVYDQLIPDEERKYSTLAAAALGIPIAHIAADDFGLFEERVPHQLEPPEPFLMNPMSAQFNESLETMGRFSRVALSGWDGDALMSEPVSNHFRKLVREIKIPTLLNDATWFVRTRHRLPPIGFRTRLKRLLGTYPSKSSFPNWIEESFRKRMRLDERWEKLTAEPTVSHLTRPFAFRFLSSPSWAPLFEGYDAGTHAFPLEMRHPLIDLRLVEFLLGIPPVPWCENKEILRRAVAEELPREIIARPKTSLAADPIRSLLQATNVGSMYNFEPVPKLREFVDLRKTDRDVAQSNADILWANLRPFALNHWLTYSLPIKEREPRSTMTERSVTRVNSFTKKAIPVEEYCQ